MAHTYENSPTYPSHTLQNSKVNELWISMDHSRDCVRANTVRSVIGDVVPQKLEKWGCRRRLHSWFSASYVHSCCCTVIIYSSQENSEAAMKSSCSRLEVKGKVNVGSQSCDICSGLQHWTDEHVKLGRIWSYLNLHAVCNIAQS